MRIEGSMTERDVEPQDRAEEREGLAWPAADEPASDRAVPEADADDERAASDADDPVEVVGAQVTPEVDDASIETREAETYEPGGGDPGVEPAEPRVEPAEPEPQVEPAEPEPQVEPEPVEPEPEPVEPSADAGGLEVDEETSEPALEADVGPDGAAAAPSAEAEPSVDAARASDDPHRGPGDWYVVHTYSGYENKVKANLESRIHTMQMEDKIFGVHIPMEDVMEIKSGKKQVVKKKQFPGYLLVRMIYDNDSWYVVRNTPGVTGFVSAGTGSKPTPLSKHEVEKILAVKKEEVRPQVRLGFEEGDVVRITSGPFADFNGTINEINPDQAKLKVLVNIFDRETPVELSFDQVSKV
jgi:transcription termination/antitermination protein NusG